MNKAKLVKDIANQTGQSQKATLEFLNAFINSVQNTVADGEQVTLVGFGTFYRNHRQATTGRNPRTGETINISASNQPKFRAGKKFKRAVNND